MGRALDVVQRTVPFRQDQKAGYLWNLIGLYSILPLGAKAMSLEKDISQRVEMLKEKENYLGRCL